MTTRLTCVVTNGRPVGPWTVMPDGVEPVTAWLLAVLAFCCHRHWPAQYPLIVFPRAPS